MKRLVRTAARGALAMRIVDRFLPGAVRRRPELALEALATNNQRAQSFGNVRQWPESVRGFEDLAFLFSSNLLNHGIALLTFADAAHLYRVARGARTVAEIGRFRGGSTFLLASALAPDGELWSYDLHVKMRGEVDGRDLDEALLQALKRFDLTSRVHIVVGDSRTADPPPRPCDLVFIDGDHKYAGARADYEAWRDRLAPGGHLLFHDAAGSTPHDGVQRAVAEVDADLFEYRGRADSIAHFVRRR